ncbi:MAG TPA: TIGR00730 family Rossman fold protein [Candidatus Ornithomonoglobus intestinigallinarum]|uniref:Cytokinin riboside 5'-monophosphate phosphoribohydrolase n=1 Tax=Candidatus Ornithomonoglobus intestinigallinarum TaxID=2840894 RepID=A0A9D1H345_9FIRM|nr:TIGR00730 family Rossman fold protein [Candidatus Ornithomonoglobus intestinigallinarum]
MNICVYGASSDSIDEVYISAVEALGEELARRGHTLIFGAGGSGCMGASARGAARGHGKIIGIVPDFFEVDGFLYEHCTELLKTDTMRERKRMLEEYADAFIVAPGGIGTFDEFFEVLTLKQLNRHSKAIAVFNANGYYDDMEKLLNKVVDENFAKRDTLELVKFFDSIDEIFDYIENYEAKEFSVEEMKHIH